VRRLTLAEVNEQHGGILPPDAVFRAGDDDARPAPIPTPKRRSRSERFAVFNTFIDVTVAHLTGAETKCWMILFRDTKKTGTARTGQLDLARRAGLSRRGVQVALDKLSAKGLVTIVRRGQLNAGPSVYRVHPVGR
jgi:hypothetical protein